MGTNAFITAYANMYPKHVIEIHKLASRGKYKEADEIIKAFKPLKTILWNGTRRYGASVEAKIYKEMADILGFNEGGTRLPIMPTPEDVKIELKKALDTINLPEIKG